MEKVWEAHVDDVRERAVVHAREDASELPLDKAQRVLDIFTESPSAVDEDLELLTVLFLILNPPLPKAKFSRGYANCG
jgi:hypothetical protein